MSFPGLSIEVRTVADGGGRKISVTAGEDLHLPSATLYWSDSSGEPSDIDGARALGQIWGPATNVFDLPDGAAAEGWLIVYSSATKEVLSAAKIQAAP